MLNFLHRNRILLASALCLFVAATLVVRAGHDPARTDRLGRAFLELMAPFQRAVTAVTRAVTETSSDIRALFRAHDENAALRAEVGALRERLDRLGEVELENERLRRLLDFRETLRGDVLTARVIGQDATRASRSLVIDRGERDGVARGAAVLAPAGIVGQVYLVARHAARVLLVTDPNSGVDAIVQRSRARGIVQGTGEAGLALKYVKRTEDIQVGDLVICSGLDGIFPKGLPVGNVIDVDKGGHGLFQNAEVSPRVDFEQLEEVLVSRGAVEPLVSEPPPDQ